MHINEIQAFLTVVQTKNMSRAAEELYISQSTITHRLKNLEQDMGITLLDRGRGMKCIQLTPAGEEFLQIAERWNALWKETESFKEKGNNLSLSFGTVESLNLCVFPALFSLLSQHIPKIKLEIHTHHTDELYSLVEKREIDVAFVLREIFSPNVIKEPWGSAPMVVLKKKSPAMNIADVIENTELDANNEIYTPWSENIFKPWHDQWWNPACRYRIQITGVNVTFPLLQSPEKWAIVPLWLAQYAAKQGNFSYYRLSSPPPDMVCYKITHQYPKLSTQESLPIFKEYLAQIHLDGDKETTP